MKVLSLFDGMSCCRLALEKLDVSVEKYYASEIDKYAIEVTQANFPDTEQLGDVTAWETWELDWASIDLVTGGFPCQAWSLAGKQLGDKDKRGKLFWTMLEVMAKVMAHNPKAFYLMENVKMKKEFESYITHHTEQALPNVYKYLINSALVSAQSRQRYYWTNIPGVEQPEDRGIVLRDILEHETDESHFVGADLQKNYQGGNQLNPTYKSQANTIHDSADKSATLAAGTHGYANGYVENPTADLVGKGGKKMLKEDIQKATALMARDYKGWNTYGMTEVRTKPKQVGKLVEKVKIRKHKVQVKALQELLLAKLKASGKSKKQIANELNDEFSTIEHYFRKVDSEFFSIPSAEHWPKLKKILKITSKKFDKQILEFEIKDGVYETKQRVYSDEGKAPTLTSGSADKLVETKPKQVGGGNREPKVVSGGRVVGRAYDSEGKRLDRFGHSVAGKTNQMLELRNDEKTNAITTVNKDSVVVSKKVNLKKYNDEIAINPRNFGGKGYIGTDKKSVALTQPSGNNATLVRVQEEDLTWRKLTPLECERLQTVPDDYTAGVSNTQRYKMLGNGWTVDVIAHIFTFMQRAHNGEHLVTKGQQSLDF
jgi:site-specific DNA-cytosine methylase